MSQAKVPKPQFSFSLSTFASELFIGGMNPLLYIPSTTIFYPVVSKGYWSIPGTVVVGDALVTGLAGSGGAGGVTCIIDSGTSAVVAPMVDAAAFWDTVPGSTPYGGGYWSYEFVLPSSHLFLLTSPLSCASPPVAGFQFGSPSASPATYNSKTWTIATNDFNLGLVSTGSSRCVGAVIGVDFGMTSWIVRFLPSPRNLLIEAFRSVMCS